MAKRHKLTKEQKATLARFQALVEQWPGGPDSIPANHPDRAWFEQLQEEMQAAKTADQANRFATMLACILNEAVEHGLEDERSAAIFEEIMQHIEPTDSLWDWFRDEVFRKIDKAKPGSFGSDEEDGDDA